MILKKENIEAMRRINIFQDNSFIRNAIAETLGYEFPQNYSWFTQDIYFETYFYLTKRFGFPEIVDDYKKISIWDFEVKDYLIRIEMNSSWVIFMVFGDEKYYRESTYPISWIKYNREKERKKHLLIVNKDNVEKRTSYEREHIQKLLDEFQIEKSIPDDISNDDFNEQYGYEFWWEKIEKFNNQIIGVNHESIADKYGRDYFNSKTRNALRTLKQFLNNMQTPIWIRDVPYNIKGRMSDGEARNFKRFENNINIKFVE